MKDMNMLDIIGNTPLVRLQNIEKRFSLHSRVYAKVERTNPSGSIKDRAAKEMIVSAMKEGRIKSDTVIIEPTSGNTGIALASVCALLKLRLIIFMPITASKERVLMMKAFGAEVRLVEKGGMSECVRLAKEVAGSLPSSFIPSQFSNKANWMAHYKETGPEIYEQMEGDIDFFVSAFGTGGTLIGVSKYLKENLLRLVSVGVEPSASAFLSKGEAGPHKIQGIGAGFEPEIFDRSYVDRIETVSDEDAYFFTRLLATEEGLLCGISSGANVAVAVRLAKESDNSRIVTVLPDNGERYLSVEGLYE